MPPTWESVALPTSAVIKFFEDGNLINTQSWPSISSKRGPNGTFATYTRTGITASHTYTAAYYYPANTSNPYTFDNQGITFTLTH
jgi:hypothetical protein